MLPYSLAADAVVVIHLLFIVFVVFGGLLALRNWRWAFVHLPAAVWGIFVEISGGICPLTPLENLLREKAGGVVYHDGFIEQYLLPTIYPEALTRQTQISLGLAVLLLNLVIYLAVYWRSRARR